MEGYISEIRFFAGNFPPQGWAFCQGQILSIAQNTALFSLVGTTYGGNGQTTFALPDLRGRVAVGAGQGPGLSSMTQGQIGGSQTTTLTVANLPSHSHTLGGTGSAACVNGGGNADSPAGAIFAGNAAKKNYAAAGVADGALAPGSIGGNTAASGGGQPFNNIEPYLGLNFIICLEGIYPSRN